MGQNSWLGKVPDKYNRVSNTDKNAENTQRSDTSGETFKVPSEEIQYTLK